MYKTYTSKWRFYLGCSAQKNCCDIVLKNGVKVNYDFFMQMLHNGWLTTEDIKWKSYGEVF